MTNHDDLTTILLGKLFNANLLLNRIVVLKLLKKA